MPQCSQLLLITVRTGEYLVKNLMACADCHGVEFGREPLSGRVEFVEMGPISATFSFPNLTPDLETGLGAWTDSEVARAIREGLDKDVIELVFMPSGNYGIMSDQDVAALIGYLRSLTPVRSELLPFYANIPGKMLVVSGLFPLPPQGKPLRGSISAPSEETVEYGKYLVILAGCRDCHGQDLKGAPVPGADPGDPNSPSINSGSYSATWTEEEFVNTFRTGINPVNRPINPEKMPIESYRNLTEKDLKLMYQYLQTQ
jgi:mono/diheme cytochrome c family protein